MFRRSHLGMHVSCERSRADSVIGVACGKREQHHFEFFPSSTLVATSTQPSSSRHSLWVVPVLNRRSWRAYSRALCETILICRINPTGCRIRWATIINPTTVLATPAALATFIMAATTTVTAADMMSDGTATMDQETDITHLEVPQTGIPSTTSQKSSHSSRKALQRRGSHRLTTTRRGRRRRSSRELGELMHADGRIGVPHLVRAEAVRSATVDEALTAAERHIRVIYSVKQGASLHPSCSRA